MFDSNTYKGRREDAWTAPTSRLGTATLFDWREREYMEMFANQQCSEEVWAEANLSGQKYKKWRFKIPRVADNEFLDTDTGVRALADRVGIVPEIGVPKPIEIRWI